MSGAMGNMYLQVTGYIPTEPVMYMKYTGKSDSSVGVVVPTFADPIEIQASVQKVKTEVYEQLGLKMEKKYKAVYSAENILSNNSQPLPDKLEFHGRKWIVCGDLSEWFFFDGWTGVLVVAENDYDWSQQ